MQRAVRSIRLDGPLTRWRMRCAPSAGLPAVAQPPARRRGRHGPGGRHDEWQVSDRRYLSEGSMALLNLTPTDTNQVAPPALLTASSAPLADPHTVKITYITERDAYPGASQTTPPA